jgi:hypothetical protein
MTTVNVTTTNNTVTVTEDGSSTVVQNPVTSVVTASTIGPQGPAAQDFILNQAAKVDKSVIYYDSASGEYRADDTWTISTIVKGGDF